MKIYNVSFYYIILLLILILSYSSLLSSELISCDYENYYVNCNNYDLIVSKESGMITSAKLKYINFELLSDYPNYSLFFPEFIPEDTLTTAYNYNMYFPPRGVNKVINFVKINTDSMAIIKFDWSTNYIRTIWEYEFINGKPYFVVNVNREVNKSGVYSNAQQCVMFSPDFDDSYIVDYIGKLFCTMSNNQYTYPTAATSQHSMFSSIDKGFSNIFPMIAWHDDEYNIIVGILCTCVSPNQRKTISYHGGGSSNSHPGYAEGQWNWFGKSDDESLFLKKGLSYNMQLYYYLDYGDIFDIFDFNQDLFNENCYELKNAENYFAASFGGRSCPNENYFWRFPQVSSNYICSQELFRHRSFSIPASQNGTRDTHIFNLSVKYESSGNQYDLTPIYGIEPLFDKAETIQGEDFMVGSMSWNVHKFDNQLNYKVYENSDKVLISGEITTLEETYIKDIFVELELSPRVSEVKTINDSVIDIRCEDEVYDQIGITVYHTQNINSINFDNNSIKLYLVNNFVDSLYNENESFEYSFSLFPHVGYNVENYDNITSLFSAPHNYYREYYLTLLGLLGNNNYGIHPNQNVFPIKAELGSDSLVVCIDIYCEPGSYPINLYLKDSIVKSVSVNGVQFYNWNYNEFTNILVLENNWEEGCYKIEIFNKELDKFCTLQNYPNPFGTSTTISFSLNNTQHTKNALIEIYNIKGQLVKRLPIINHQTSIKWNGTDESGKSVSNGIYFYKLINNKESLTKKMLLMR